MKITHYIVFGVFFLIVGCEHTTEFRETSELTDGFCIVSNDVVLLNHHDIEYYDFSSHLIYLKEDQEWANELGDFGSFEVYALETPIYTAQFWPAYSSLLPSGPIVHTQPKFYNNNILAISFVGISDQDGNATVDPRTDERIITALEKYGQYHVGLSCEISALTYTAPGRINLELTLINEDSFDYLYLDPLKMGHKMYHYFTNGLYLQDQNRETVYHQELEVAQPDPWNSWDKSWLSLIPSGSTKKVELVYERFQELAPGNYTASFQFPGLSYQVVREEIEQEEGRIWLGMLNLKVRFNVENNAVSPYPTLQVTDWN